MTNRLLLGAVAAILLAGAAAAQPAKFTSRLVAVPTETSTPAERIYQLEQQNAQLKAQLAQLQQQLNALKAADDKGFFDDRFRITALEAKSKTQFDALPGQVSALGGQIGSLNYQLGNLDSRFKAHTHTYTSEMVGWSSLPQMKKLPDAVGTTSPPK